MPKRWIVFFIACSMGVAACGKSDPIYTVAAAAFATNRSGITLSPSSDPISSDRWIAFSPVDEEKPASEQEEWRIQLHKDRPDGPIVARGRIQPNGVVQLDEYLVCLGRVSSPLPPPTPTPRPGIEWNLEGGPPKSIVMTTAFVGWVDPRPGADILVLKASHERAKKKTDRSSLPERALDFPKSTSVGKVFILDLPNRTDVVTAQGQVIVPAGCEAVFLQERVSVARGVLDYLKNLDRRGLYVPRQHWSNVDDETLLGAPRFEGVTSILTFERNPDLTNRGLALFDDNQKVEVIQLSHTSITDAGLVHLAGMRSLRELMIVRFEESGAGVTGEGLAHLVESHDLKVLNLSNNPITDAAIPHIIAFKKLSYLNLKGTRITSRGLAVLTRELPQCQIVSDLPVPRSSTPPKTGPIG